ncbi:MAG: nucleotide exchange factor GrpE [Balneolales bacterium]|nr:nucleotide exchange factor GrpE [Balneolales bacterium]
MSKKNNTSEAVNNGTQQAEDSAEKLDQQEAKQNAENTTPDKEAPNSTEALDLLAENERLKSENQDLKDKLLRKAAEFENIKRRTQRERVQMFDDAKIQSVIQFLPVFDDLERTINALPEGQKDSLSEGVRMVYTKFKNILEKTGIESVNETGVPFDVELHDALMKQAAPDSKTGSDVVLQVLEPGYKLGEKIIRHAKVIVSE